MEIAPLKNVVHALQHNKQLDSNFNTTSVNHKKKEPAMNFTSKNQTALKFKKIRVWTVTLRSILIVILFTTFIVISSMISFAISIILKTNKIQIIRHVNQAMEMNLLFDKFGVLFVPLYDYMTHDTHTTVKNQPTDLVWNQAYQDCANSAQFYHSLKEGLDAESLKQYNDLLSGDLCSIVSDPAGC